MRIGFSKKVPPPIDQNCVGYWKFDKASGVIEDLSGNNNSGTHLQSCIITTRNQTSLYGRQIIWT